MKTTLPNITLSFEPSISVISGGVMLYFDCRISFETFFLLTKNPENATDVEPLASEFYLCSLK